MKTVKGYRILVQQDLKELDATGYLLEHEKTKARVAVIETEDDNKVFSIGFRTPPKDSTGVAHIVEHTVLCGSKEFPVKDPFIELAKGSLNTFLNAMTYPDKTVYPVASCNEKDFQNLMHVYLDAVFYPNIYKEEKIFKQEGWHYELDHVEGPLRYNGVVYNEMKGAYSSPEQLMERKIQQSLFPDTTYGFESGGDPECIPDLSYPEYLEFHKRYYHPSNSYIYLYGDMDMVEKLEWIDAHYLSHFDYLDVDSEIQIQQPFEVPHEMTEYYSLTEDESEEEKTYFSYNAVTGTSLDKELYLAFQVLNHVLVQSVGAPVKQALLDAGVGSEIISFFEESIRQPVFSIIAKNVASDKKELFVRVIREQLEKLVNEGIDKASLNAGLNSMEFRYREADFGSYPKGLMYGLQMFDSWLYEDEKAFIHIRANDTFETLRTRMNEGYFESLIQKYLLDNTHRSVVTIEPKKGLSGQIEQKEAKELADYLATLSIEEKEKLITDTVELKKYQEEPSPKEDLEKIPLLAREDIRKKATGFSNIKKQIEGCEVIHHDYFTNGIHYISLLFDIKPLLSDYAPYISLLMSVLGSVDTDLHSKLEYSNEILQNAGGMSFDTRILKNRKQNGVYRAYATFGTKVFTNKSEKILDLFYEAVSCSHLEDEKRLREIISEQASSLQMSLISAGHTTAVSRGLAYLSEASAYDEALSGISYYRFLKKLEDEFDEQKDNLIQILKYLTTEIFVKDRLLAGITCAKEDYPVFEKALAAMIGRLPESGTAEAVVPAQRQENIPKNEGFLTAGQVQYVARVGRYFDQGFRYNGAFLVLKTLLSYEYLWNEVRVKGGAYGVMCGFSPSGEGYFVSYRDPNLMETNDVFVRVPEYLACFEADEREMTKFIIGTMSSVDTPLTPRAKGTRSMNAYLTDVTQEDIQRDREQILQIHKEDIRACAQMVQAIMADKKICVLGNEDKIKKNRELFDVTETL